MILSITFHLAFVVTTTAHQVDEALAAEEVIEVVTEADSDVVVTEVATEVATEAMDDEVAIEVVIEVTEVVAVTATSVDEARTRMAMRHGKKERGRRELCV